MEIQDAAILPLTPLERVGPKGYLRYVFVFDLGEDYDIDNVSNVLRAGYKAVKHRIPTIGCEAVPDVNHQQAGNWKLVRLAEDEVEDVAVKDLRGTGFTFSYKELKSHGFPVSAFNADTVCRRGIWVSPGERIPISMVQLNFITGGLVLSWETMHMAGDSITYDVWCGIWAEECRRAQGLAIDLPYPLEPAMVTDRQKVMRPSGKLAGRAEDHPEYTVLPQAPREMPAKMLSTSHCGHVFRFSKDALNALKEEASPSKAKDPRDVSWVSTNDALSALLWRTVMAVQRPVDSLGDEDPVSVFNIAIDARRRTEPAVHPRTLGCFLGYVAVSAPIRSLLDELSLADLAVLIRRAVASAGQEYADDVATLIESVDDVGKVLATAMLDVPGNNCVLTSWKEFGLYKLDWGPLLGGHVDAVRCPHVGVINGLQVVLPELPDGSMEILVGVEEDCLGRLLQDPFWNRFAVGVGE